MGLFSRKKEKCVICNIEEGSKKISDGMICSKCLQEAGLFLPINKTLKVTTSDDVRNSLIESKNNKELYSNFVATKTTGYFIADEKNKLWIIPGKKGVIPKVYKFTDIVNYELLEDGETITKGGGLGRAIAGGILFGGVGAVVGGVTGGRKSKELINSLRIKITIKNNRTPELYINLITMKTKSTSMLYKLSYEGAQSVLSILDLIADENKTGNDTPSGSNISVADELIKLKKLVDQGVITEEDFNLQKDKLINM